MFPRTVVGHVFSATVITRIGVSSYSCWTRVLCYSYYTYRCFLVQLLDTCSLLQLLHVSVFPRTVVGHVFSAIYVPVYCSWTHVPVLASTVTQTYRYLLAQLLDACASACDDRLSDVPVFTFTVFLFVFVLTRV